MRITPAPALLVVWGPQEIMPVKRWTGCPAQDTRDWQSVPYRESQCALFITAALLLTGSSYSSFLVRVYCPCTCSVCHFPWLGAYYLHLNYHRRLPAGPPACLVPRLPPSILFLMGLPETPLTDTPAKAGIFKGPPFPSCSLRSRSLTLYHDVAPSVFIAHEHTLQAVKWQVKVSSVAATPTHGGQLFMCTSHCYSSAVRGRACALLCITTAADSVPWMQRLITI